MSDLRLKAAQKLASAYGKQYGILVATGSAALEVALAHVGVTSGQLVIVPSLSCYQVAASVLRVGAIPIFVSVNHSLLLSPEGVSLALNKYSNIGAIIAVHHLGLPCNILGIKQVVPSNLPIIEDAAQAWNLLSASDPIGKHSDVVVTSLGSSKPLSVGEGGAVFSNEKSLVLLVDTHSPESRMRPHVPFPYAISPHAIPHIDRAIHKANFLIESRRYFVETFSPFLEKKGFQVWVGEQGDQPSWHRIPVRATSQQHREEAISHHLAHQLGIQLPHQVPLHFLPMFKGRSKKLNHGYDADADNTLFFIPTNPIPQRDILMERWLC